MLDFVFTTQASSGTFITIPATIANFTEGADFVSGTLPADPATTGATIDNRVVALVAAADYVGNTQNPSAWGAAQNFSAFVSAQGSFTFSARPPGSYYLTWEARDRSFDPDLRSGWAPGRLVEIGELSVPDQMGGGDWAVGPAGTPRDFVVTVVNAPFDGNTPITDYVITIDGGPDISLGIAAPGTVQLNDQVPADGTYSIAIKAVNAQGQGPLSASKTVVVAADTTPPNLSLPTAAANGSTAYTGTVTTDEASGALYWLVSTNPVYPGDAALLAAQMQPVAVDGVQAVSGGGLIADTPYYVHFLHIDSAGNTDAGSRATAAEFTTPESGGNLPAINFSDPPTQAQVERLITERWHTRPDWLYDGTTPKTITNNLAELPAGLSYDAGSNRITVNGTVVAISGWDFAATQTELNISGSGDRINLIENCKFAPEAIPTNADRLNGGTLGRCMNFGTNSTNTIGTIRKCWFTKLEESVGPFDENGWAIFGNRSSGSSNYPLIELMEYCSFEGGYTDPLKGIWGGERRYCFFDCAYNIPLDAEEWQSGKTYNRGDIVFRAADAYYLRMCLNNGVTASPNWGSKLASTSNWSALDPHTDLDQASGIRPTVPHIQRGNVYFRDENFRRFPAVAITRGIVNALRYIRNTGQTHFYPERMDFQYNIFSRLVQANGFGQRSTSLPDKSHQVGNGQITFSNNWGGSDLLPEAASHVSMSGNDTNWSIPNATANISGVSASYGGGAITYDFTTNRSGWMRIVVMSSSAPLSATEIKNARLSDSGVLAIFEIDAAGGTTASGSHAFALSGTGYANGLFQAGGGVYSVAPLQTVT